MARWTAVALLLAPLAYAQSPPPPAPGTVTADATEVVRVKPDQARVVFYARARNPDPAPAADETAETVKKFTEAVDKLKLKGAKVAVAPLQSSRVSEENNRVFRGGGGGAVVVPPKDVQASREVVVTVSDAEFATLSEAVEKLQREAYAVGLSGDRVNNSYNPYGSGESERVRVTYHRKDGVEDATAAALARATKKATARAESIAAGLGVKLGAVVSAGEVDESASPANPYGTDPVEMPKDELVDGELVRKVRVRVVYGVAK